jgi:hypothetical protein
LGHQSKDCRAKRRERGERLNEEKHVTNVVQERIFVPDKEAYNFDTYNACNSNGNDERMLFYDWLADSATTSHVTHEQSAFTSYTPMKNASVIGVGGKQSMIAGQGTVELISTCNGKQYILYLQRVLHVPGTRNNLILLEKWDKVEGRYIGENGTITLINRHGEHVAEGNRITNDLYKMQVKVKRPGNMADQNEETREETFIAREPAPVGRCGTDDLDILDTLASKQC